MLDNIVPHKRYFSPPSIVSATSSTYRGENIAITGGMRVHLRAIDRLPKRLLSALNCTRFPSPRSVCRKATCKISCKRNVDRNQNRSHPTQTAANNGRKWVLTLRICVQGDTCAVNIGGAKKVSARPLRDTAFHRTTRRSV